MTTAATTQDTTTSGTTLSVLLRERTTAAHQQAETSTFMDDLTSGRASADAWTALATQLYPIYHALESATEQHKDHPLIAPLYDTALRRTERLAADLNALLGTDAADRIAAGEVPLLPATRNYIAALTTDLSPETIVANHYVRYLGDLSGGQIISAMLRRHYDIAPEALNFYRFPDIPKLKVYKDRYRAALDQLPADEFTQGRIISEAIAAFRYNQALFADLEATAANHDTLAG